MIRMKVTVKYSAQARLAAGVGSEDFQFPGPAAIRDLVVRAAEGHGDPLRGLLLAADGSPHPSLLIFVGDEQVRPDAPRELRPDDVVTLMPPIAGG